MATRYVDLVVLPRGGLHARIKKQRIRQGITPAEAAHLLGCSQQNYHRIEGVFSTPKLETLWLLAEIFECTVCDLIPPEWPIREESRDD